MRRTSTHHVPTRLIDGIDPDAMGWNMSQRGFTLIEIMVVITVIAILATLVAPNVFQHVGTAQDATARAQIEMLGAALDAYRLDNGRYPTTQQGLAALVAEPGYEPRPRN